MNGGKIQAIQEQEITLDSNTAAIPFSTTDIRTRSAINCRGWMLHNDGSAIFNILEGGYYEANFGTSITSNTAGIVAIGLFSDGVYIPGTRREVTIGAAGEWHSISFEKELAVCCKTNASITVNSLPTSTYSGGGTTVITDTQIPIIKGANFSIER